MMEPGDRAIQEQLQLEEEMNKMYLDLNETENRIRDNRDLKEMEGFMHPTQEHLTTHMKAFETLKNNIMLVN